MANVIELEHGERLPDRSRLALVISSASYPVSGTSVIDRGTSRTFFATRCELDIALIVGRAMSWADAREIMTVYLRRDP